MLSEEHCAGGRAGTERAGGLRPAGQRPRQLGQTVAKQALTSGWVPFSLR